MPFQHSKSFLTGVLATLLAAAAGLQAQALSPSEAVERMGAIPIAEWTPKSSLVVQQTDVPKARYPVIDVHAHIYAQTPAEVAEWVSVMDQVGIEKSIILTSTTGERFDQAVALYLDPYPDRFVIFAGILRERVNDPDYPQRAVAELERNYRLGARGLGELTDKGLGLSGDASLTPEQRLHPDDPRLDLFWAKARELNMPANIHFADHPSAWEPPDHTQERTPGFQRFNQYGRNSPSHAEVLQIRDRFLKRHPDNIVIACHFSNQGHDFASLAKTLDTFPNLYLDIAARQYEFGRQPRAAAAFFNEYSDRLLFGTDRGREADMYRSFWQTLETADEYLPGQSWWMLYGLDLPDSVLHALYRNNALRLLNWQ